MNNLKFALLALGALGLVGCFLPIVSDGPTFWELPELKVIVADRSFVILTMAGFAAAVVAGLVAIVKPPMQRWQSVLAVVGFALVILKLRAGIGTGGGFLHALQHGAIGAKFMCGAPILGIAVAILSMAKPETAR